jgi:hypothetical protein
MSFVIGRSDQTAFREEELNHVGKASETDYRGTLDDAEGEEMSWLGPLDYRWESPLPPSIKLIISVEAIRTSRWVLLGLAEPCGCDQCRGSKRPFHFSVPTLLVPNDGLRSAEAHYPSVEVGYLDQDGLILRGKTA